MSRNKAIRDSLSVESLKELIDYNSETGKFFWKERPLKYCKSSGWQDYWNRRFAGKEAMTATRSHGYKQGTILEGNYRAHRVAWFYTYGYWPDEVDHINGDTSDNRLKNLREVSVKQNMKNVARSPSNKTGISGVYWCDNRNKWAVKISINNKTKFLGRFDDFFEACCVRKSADNKYGFHLNHGRR